MFNQLRQWLISVLFVIATTCHVEAQDETVHDDSWFPNFGLRNLSDTTIQLPFNATLDFYGQFSPVVMVVDDGKDVYATLADNNHSVSRVGAVVKRQADGRIFQFQFETSLGIRSSSQVTQGDKGAFFDWNRSDIRVADFSWKFANGQVFSVGQGKMATDGVTLMDLSGTGIANSASIPDIGGSYRFRTDAGVLSNIEISDVFQTFDGVRRVRVRFDTRSRYGFWFSVSAGVETLEKNSNQQDIDASVFYESDGPKFKLQAAAGQSISKLDGEETRADTIGSISVLHKATGLNATFATGARLGQGSYVYFKLGYIAQLLPYGQTAFAVDFQNSENIVNENTSGNAWGLAAVQTIDDLNTEVFLGYRNFRFSENSVIRYRDVNAVFFGARWRF